MSIPAGWTESDGALHREWTFASFNEAWGLHEQGGSARRTPRSSSGLEQCLEQGGDQAYVARRRQYGDLQGLTTAINAVVGGPGS